MEKRSFYFNYSIIALTLLIPIAGFAQSSKSRSYDLDSLLRAVRARYDLPALGAALIVDGKVVETEVIGVRKYGDTTRATINDTWHIGSDTKSMTATLLGKLVELGKLRWETKIIDVFPELIGKIDTAFNRVTLEMLLCHHSGIKGDSWPSGMTYDAALDIPGSPREQRITYMRAMLAEPPAAPPGTTYIYSNAGFAIAGAMAERVMDRAFEDLLNEFVFRPLSITSAGFGSMNTPGKVDEPWQHTRSNGAHVPIDGGPRSDNPEAITPAGRVHLSLGDWCKYAIAHLQGETAGGLLRPATFIKLHSLPFGGQYGFGWLIIEPKWANGKALAHDGSNNQNYASIFLAPNLKFGILVVTNEGGEEASAAVPIVVSSIIKKLWVKK